MSESVDPISRRYTLDEARRELAREECGAHGHDFDVRITGAGDPTIVWCRRCDRSWQVLPFGMVMVRPPVDLDTVTDQSAMGWSRDCRGTTGLDLPDPRPLFARMDADPYLQGRGDERTCPFCGEGWPDTASTAHGREALQMLRDLAREA